MKILHVIGGLAWPFGGTTATILHLTEALRQLPGVEVAIATTDADGKGGHLTEADRPRTAVPVHYFRHDWSERWTVSLGLRRWLRNHVQEFDLVHVHSVWSFSTTAACRAARRAKVPYIIIPQGMLSPYTFSRSRGMKSFYWRWIEEANVRQARCLHLTTEAERAELAPLELTNPTRVVPLGVEAEAWEAPNRAAEFRAKLSPERRERPVLLYLSRLHPKKGIADVLLPAFAPLRERAFLVIAGGVDGHEAAYAELVRRRVQDLGLEKDVQLYGAVPSADRFGLMDAADLFVLPSHHENFGIVAIEALARKLPAVISRNVQCCEHVEKAEGGVVLPLEVNAFSVALEKMLAQPSERARLGLQGQEYVKRHLGWDTIAQQMLGVYEECLVAPA